ncbi:PLP-dependent aminotransferase family protein [Pseudomonas sp. Teo4]|uniref:MocR-like pyridoxine biosynthesis transcription factor PdxR n=1 Tax=Pseudomonas sp. Teo4 TaxID=3064528 RepID=UPI002AB8B2FB|nr:PLP-dependent aminotransferase family protein [Pseudomonas sp. Teo4]MDZ3991892.1 HTH-type transcriptional regulator TauR [Pseudomonas sp. Teo4]
MRNSRHDLMWKQLLPETRRNDDPLQVQLSTAFVNAILDGRLLAGSRLPSGRDLARLTGVSRNTAVLAYERLVAEGYVEARPRDGFFVYSAIKPTDAVTGHGPSSQQGPDWGARLPGAISRVQWADRPNIWRDVRYPFVYGQFDHRLFPIHQWRQCSRQALELRAVDRWWQEGEDLDSTQLISQLIRRVLPRRGIAASEYEVLLTLGRQQSFYLLARLFARPGSKVAVENPGFRDPRNVFAYEGADVVPVPLDDEGLVLNEALASCDYLYCTPGYQCPTGITMSAARRRDLLQLAQDRDLVIFEDDDDPETEYDGQAHSALKACDQHGRVIYMSSLSKLLSPGLGIGFIVAPAPVIAELRSLQRLMIRQTPGNNQIATALFIQQGHYDRLLQQTRDSLAHRAALLVQALRQELPEARFTVPTGGATLWLRLPHCADSLTFYYEALAEGVLLDPSMAFYFHPEGEQHQFVRLGFGAIAVERIAPGVRELARIVAEHGRRHRL